MDEVPFANSFARKSLPPVPEHQDQPAAAAAPPPPPLVRRASSQAEALGLTGASSRAALQATLLATERELDAQKAMERVLEPVAERSSDKRARAATWPCTPPREERRATPPLK